MKQQGTGAVGAVDDQPGEVTQDRPQCRAPGGCPCFDHGGVCDRGYAQCEERS